MWVRNKTTISTYSFRPKDNLNYYCYKNSVKSHVVGGVKGYSDPDC